MDLKQQFKTALPNTFFLEKNIDYLTSFLQSKKLLQDSEQILDLSKPGEGNMNFVLRVKTNLRSFIVKQSRPFVQKYPQIAAPVERIIVEAKFFQTIAQLDSINEYSPKVIAFDGDNYILLLEDLGDGKDYSFLYQKEKKLDEKEINDLVHYLNKLHHHQVNASFPLNMELRKMNFEHIFNFPFSEDNGMNLDEVQMGLQELSMTYKTDKVLKNKIKNLGNTYLSAGTNLLHGDYYPGSWLKVGGELKIIDPEFAFVGRAEFDLSVLIAHLTMAQQQQEKIQQVFAQYQKPKHFDNKLLAQLAGTEIMRRIIGIAQLPLSLNLEEKKKMMERAVDWINKEVL